MGSGYWAEDGWTYAAFQSNLLVQTDRNGGLADYNGNGWASDPDMYDIVTQMQSGTSWGSYFWMGEPGAG
jgi:Neprosin